MTIVTNHSKAKNRTAGRASGLTSAQSGEFDEMERKYRKRICQFAYKSLNNMDDAEDVTQKIFINAYKAFGTFRGESKLSTWLVRIAINAIKDHAKHKRRMAYKEMQIDDPDIQARSEEEDNAVSHHFIDPQPGPEQSLLTKSEAEKALEVYDNAPLLPQQRKAFGLVAFDGLKYREAAAVLGIPIDTVKTYINRTRSVLVKEMPNF